MRAAVAFMTEEQKFDVLVLLECNTENLAGLPDGYGIQDIKSLYIIGLFFSFKTSLSTTSI